MRSTTGSPASWPIASAAVWTESFRAGRVDAVYGLQLSDAGRVVLKVHRPPVELAHLAATVAGCATQRARLPMPGPLDGPVLVDGRTVTVESLLTEGTAEDAHRPAIRQAMVAALAEQVELLAEVPGGTGALASRLGPGPSWTRYAGGPWPEPHDPVFDFSTTPAGWQWLDDYGRRGHRRSGPPPRHERESHRTCGLVRGQSPLRRRSRSRRIRLAAVHRTRTRDRRPVRRWVSRERGAQPCGRRRLPHRLRPRSLAGRPRLAGGRRRSPLDARPSTLAATWRSWRAHPHGIRRWTGSRPPGRLPASERLTRPPPILGRQGSRSSFQETSDDDAQQGEGVRPRRAGNSTAGLLRPPADDGVKVILAALESGVRLIDTALAYTAPASNPSPKPS